MACSTKGSRVQLVNYLQQENRYAESIPILEPLVKFNPRAMNYRTRLMAAYFHSKRPERLAELVKRRKSISIKKGGGTRGMSPNLATAASIAICSKRRSAISMKRSRFTSGPIRPAAWGTAGLSVLCINNWPTPSQVWAKPKRRSSAAAASIVCWGPNHTQRADAIRKAQRSARRSQRSRRLL